MDGIKVLFAALLCGLVLLPGLLTHCRCAEAILDATGCFGVCVDAPQCSCECDAGLDHSDAPRPCRDRSCNFCGLTRPFVIRTVEQPEIETGSQFACQSCVAESHVVYVAPKKLSQAGSLDKSLYKDAIPLRI